MSVICIVIGVLMLLGFTGAGYFVGSYLLSQEVIVNLLGLTGTSKYMVMLVFCAIGLLFCLNWVVLGANCAAIGKLKKRRKKRKEAQA